MRRVIFTSIVPLVFLASCKTTSPHLARVKSEAPETPVEPSEARLDNSKETLCASLKGESFPDDNVMYQIQWLCERGGFDALKEKSFGGNGAVAITEYFEEHDKTLYYAAGFSIPGSFEKITQIGSLFCDDFELLRKKFGGRGFESIKTVRVSSNSEGECEYLQVAVPEWGIKGDIKGNTKYGRQNSDSVFWRVDAMVAPLNYSPLKQYSALFLAWNNGPKLDGVYLIRSQVSVPGVFMGTSRARLKSTMSALLEGYGQIVQ